MTKINKPKLSNGALELLRIACENDRHKAMVYNSVFSIVLEFGKQLILACQHKRSSELLELLDVRSPPRHFLSLTAIVLHRVRMQQNDLFHGSSTSPKVHIISDFDRHVLQGFAEALADLIWPKRKASDFDGPSLEVCISRLADYDTRDLWIRTIQHYLANVLQHYFAASRIRSEVKNLDFEIESKLRQKDARDFAEYVMNITSTLKRKETNLSRLLEAFQSALDSII